MHEAHGISFDRSQILRDQALIQERALEMQRSQPPQSLPESQETPSPIRCSTCGRSFARREHLRRHQKTHTKERPYQCPTCGKDFSRQDVLNRHLAAHQSRDAFLSTPTVSARACEQCAIGRARCTKQQPCQRCFDRKLDCRYPAKKRRRGSHSSQPESREEVASSLPDTSASDSGVTSHEVTQQLFDPPALQQPIEDSSASLISAPAESALLNSWTANAGLNPTSSTLYDFTQPGLGLSSINWMSPQEYQFGDWDAQLADFLKQREDPTVNTSFPFFFPDPGEKSDSHLYDASMDMSIAPNPQVGLSLGSSQTETHRTPSSSDGGSKRSNSTEGNYYVDGTGARAAFGGRRKQRFSIANVDVLHEEDIPDAPSSSTTGNLVSHAAYEFMMAGIREVMPQQPIQDSSLSHAQIQTFVHQYFESFHTAFPFIRPANLRELSHDWTLLLAVAATGSRYSRRSQGLHSSDFLLDALHKRLRRLMYEPASMDDTTPFAPGQSIRGHSSPRLQTVQARVLAVTCMLHSGRKTLMDSALVDRQYLVEACNSLGLLAASADQSQGSTGKSVKSGDWLPREDHTRTGIMVWLLDTMLSYQFDCKPLMSLADVQCSLPGSEALWESMDAEGTIIRRSNQPLTLPEAMDLLYIEKRTPPNLGEFSVSLLIHAIFRKTREVIAWEQTRMTAWTPSTSVRSRQRPPTDDNWLPNTAATSRWRNSACDCLDVLHWSANSRTASRSGSEHHTILLLHLSRLVLLAPTKHIQALANTSTTQTAVGTHATARDQVLQWVVRDQYKARLCIVHCGALFWHVRRYSCDSVIEPFAIYIATLVLWAFSVSTQFVGQDAIHSYATCASPTGPATSHHPEDDTVPSFLHLDRPLDDELVQAFVRIGYKMSGFIMGVGNIQGPGAPGKIVQEGLRLLGRSTQGADGRGQAGMMSAPDGNCLTWGIEGPYMESLRQMAQASTS